jgi:SAM-dependent methyltransferase
MKQEHFFLEQEANNWFQRNRSKIESTDYEEQFDWICYYIELFNNKNQIKTIAELGCSNGWRLNRLSSNSGKYFVGIDASLDAIQSGQERYPHLKLYHGILSQLPIEEEFDLVIVAGVLNCVDRNTLVKSIAEIDRVTKDGGILIIGDFLPVFNQRRHNHHCSQEAIYTYKQDYAKIFEAFGTYRELMKTVTNFGQQGIPIDLFDSSSSFGFTVLQKSLHDFYPEI